MKRNLLFLILLALLSAPLAAHNGATHVMGTVAEITGTTIKVKTGDSKMETVTVTPDTKFVNSGEKAVREDLKVGERVVIDAVEHSHTLHAVEVKFGAPAKASHAAHH